MTRRRWSADEQVIRRAALRIAAQAAAGVAITVLGLAAVAVAVVLHNQHQADDEQITMAIARADDVTDPPAGIWLAIMRPGRLVVSPGLPEGLPDRAQLTRVAVDRTPRTVDFTAHGREYRVDTQPLTGGGAIQALLDLSADHAERFRLLEALLITGTAGLAVAAGVGLWLGRRAITPMADALALQRRFVADASHELRTPLTLLSTRAQLIRRELRDHTAPGVLESDVDALLVDARHLTDILEDLLLAADPREPSEHEPIRLSTVVEQAVASARPLADERAVSLVCTTIEQPPAFAGAPTGLRRAVTALLDNAIRHAANEVRVTVGLVGGYAVVDVADDGPGIEPDLVPTLFTRFATSPADRRPGVRRRYGLGLALVSEIAARHGGSVSVVDTGRSGATFRLRLRV